MSIDIEKERARQALINAAEQFIAIVEDGNIEVHVEYLVEIFKSALSEEAARASLAAPEPVTLIKGMQLISEEQIAQLEIAAECMQAIANKKRIVYNEIHPVRTINDAAKLARGAHNRIANVISCLDLNRPSEPVTLTDEEIAHSVQAIDSTLFFEEALEIGQAVITALRAKEAKQ